jgi:hypothetical protein
MRKKYLSLVSLTIAAGVGPWHKVFQYMDIFMVLVLDQYDQTFQGRKICCSVKLW